MVIYYIYIRRLMARFSKRGFLEVIGMGREGRWEI